MAFSLQEALEQIRSDKIKDRQQGLEALEHIFAEPDNVLNLDPKQDGKAWLKTFQSLFACVLAEKAACIKKGSLSDAQPVALARLQRAAQMVRSIVEKAAPLLARKVVKALVNHIIQMLNHRGCLLRPVAPAYTSALCAILKHQHHVDHLDPEDWIASTSLCFGILLGRDLDNSVAPSDPEEWLASIPTTITVPHSRRGLSLEDAVTADCLRHLMACTVAPLLGPEGYGLSLLADYTRFLLCFPAESSAHLPAVTGLVILLEHLELNNTRAVVYASLSLRHVLLVLWKTKNYLVKVRLLLLLRIVTPVVASSTNKQTEIGLPQDPSTLQFLRTEAIIFLELIHEALLYDPDTRWALEPMRLDALVFRCRQSSGSELSSPYPVLCNSAFHLGPSSTEQDSLSWCRISLQVDLIEALTNLGHSQQKNGLSALSGHREAAHEEASLGTASNSLSSPRTRASNGKRGTDPISLSSQKRRRTGVADTVSDTSEHDWLQQLVRMVSNSDTSTRSSVTARLCTLQLIIFVVLTRPHLIDATRVVEIRGSLLALAADTESTLVSWSLIGLSAVVLGSDATNTNGADGGPNSVSAQHGTNAWGVAVRKLQNPDTCRAAAFLLCAMLAKGVLPEAALQPEVTRLLAEVDLQGPPILCDSVCQLMTRLLHLATSNNVYQHLDPRRKVGAWFASVYTSAPVFQPPSGGLRKPNLLTPYHDLVATVNAMVVENGSDLPESQSWATSTRRDDVAELLGRRARSQSLRDLALNGQIVGAPASRRQVSPAAVEAGPSLLSSEAFNRMTLVLEKKINACLASLKALSSDTSSATAIPFQAVIAVMHAAILSLDLWSRSTPQTGSQRLGRLQRCCQVIITAIDVASSSKSMHPEESNLVIQQLELIAPLRRTSMRSAGTSNDLLRQAGVASGIAAYTADVLDDSIEAHQDDSTRKRIWTAIREANMLEAMLSSCDRLLERTLFGDEDAESDPASATLSKNCDAFDDMPESSTTSTIRTQNSASSGSMPSAEAIVNVTVRLLGGVPRLLTGNADSKRDELIVSMFFDCSIEGLITLSPVFFESLHEGSLWMSQRDLVDALARIGSELLTSYRFAREPAARLAAVRAVSAVLPILFEEVDEQSDFFDKVQKLASFFADQIGRTKWPTPWKVQLACADFLAECLRLDPEGRLCRSGSARGSNFWPHKALLKIHRDCDIRVRGLGASIATSVFDTTSNDEEHMSGVYKTFREGLPSDSSLPPHILTRALSLCNVVIANSAVRRSALFHLLEIVLATSMFPVTIQQLFARVSARLGFPDASSCYQAFAGQIIWGMATNNYDPLQVPWKVLGFPSKRECLESTFSACGSMLLAAQTPEGRTQFDALVQLTRRTQQQGLQECLPFLTAAYLGFAVQAGQQGNQPDLASICKDTLRELSSLGFVESEQHAELRQMLANADDFIVTTLLTLYFEPAFTHSDSRNAAIAALTQQDARHGKALSALTPSSDVATPVVHEPSRPFFPAAVSCAALMALPSLGIEPFRKNVVYNVLRRVFHEIVTSQFVNDQLRLCAALRIYIAMCGDSFWSDHLNAQLLIRCIEQLLGQRHLRDELQPILTYACSHSSLATVCPESLVSCIIAWSVEIREQLAQSPQAGDWLIDAARAVAKTSPIATSVTALLWPVKLQSAEQVAIESLIDIETLTFAIEACPSMSLQLPSLLRIRSVLRKASKEKLEKFCHGPAWKLLEHMAECQAAPSLRSNGDLQTDVMGDIFVSIMGVGETVLLQRKLHRIGGQRHRIAAGVFLGGVETSSFSSLSAASVLTIHALAHNLPLEQNYQAFETLRHVAAAIQVPLTEIHPTNVPVNTREELNRIRPSIGSVASTSAVSQLEDLLDPSLLGATVSSRDWICRLSAMLCDLLCSMMQQPVFRPVRYLVSTNTNAAEALFPILLLCFTAEDVHREVAHTTSTGKRRTSDRRSDAQEPFRSQELCRSAVATHFEQVLEWRGADPACSELIVQALLAVRSFRPVQEEPDKVCYWYDVDTSLLARRCIACGLYSAAIFFVEHSIWEQDESQAIRGPQARTRTNLLHQAYMNIDDPDAFYGITDGDVRELLLRRLQHEGQWLRAFQYHAAGYEASASDGANLHGTAAQALGQSLSLLGFQHLHQKIDAGSMIGDNLANSAANGQDWNSSSWDLPAYAVSSFTKGQGVEAVLQILRQAGVEQDVDAPLSLTFQSQLRSLCSTPLDSIAAMRRIQGDLLALGQVKDWRKASASLGADEAVAHLRSVWTQADMGYHFDVTEKMLNTRQSVLQAARQRMQANQIGDVLDGPAEQAARVERSLLVVLSRQAREHEKLQKAINATARAERIESALADGANIAREEFAAVLWDQHEHPPAIQLLSRIVDGLNLSATSLLPQKRRKARLLALLAQWRATTRSQHPTEIDRSLFEPALKLIASSMASETTADAEQSEIAYRWARFAEEQHRGSDVAEITRLRLYIERRGEEIAQNQREFDRTSSKTERSKLLQFQRQAEKILRQDQSRLTELEATTTHFLRRSVVMYARALSSSDAHDDAVARLISLWFEKAGDAELNRLLASCSSSIPSRKFVALMHQLSARLTEVTDSSDAMAPFQSNLTSLLVRMCQDHPFHCLYAIFALIKTGAEAKQAANFPRPRSSFGTQDSRGSSPSPQILRSIAAEKIWNQVKRRSTSGKRIQTFEEVCLAYVDWAEFDLASRPDRYFQSSGSIKKGALRMPPSGELRLARIRNLDVPVATARLELDHTCKYEHFVSIARYSETFTTAGGIHLPKISECIGSDGKRYKQLFKRDDDLRQDAVMQQVFRVVNELLHDDRRTCERKLAIRTYTVLPLGPQCGMLEFVTNTVPLGEVLIALHARYRPNDLTPTQARNKMRDAQPLPAEAKLEAFLDVCKGMRPAFRYFFSDAQRMPRDWYETRLRYTRSVSTNSIVGHVLGLGDRHVSNILLDKESGELVHIDFGVAFDQGKLLPIPELVPFRLTRDIVDGMGIHGVEGTFRRCCEETLRVLRAHEDVIKTVLEVFRHDPLFAWTSNPIKVLRAQEAEESMMPAPSAERSGPTARSTLVSMPAPTLTPANAARGRVRSTTPFVMPTEAAAGVVGTDTADLSADRAVTSVMTKLSSSLSIEYTVNDLIQQAMDAGNLSAIFHGWQAAL
ncbi:related to TEL1 - telomere length control protein [Melanopsichium pennsylvanicum]|uniref:Serine/threonine-protein kinase TEL1 n=2 Tax=Melanopsichium pennsylvanicum TaxID=63383 RepID=A0AAJ5C6W7_9BASI|nr:related to TEL1-telomere length control protein [Melanopsichium pennsylvanicum 4]SNX86282.1 related to TEL1 - telomere length control protein [Melanopsichium pennsylvanicum]